MAELLYEIKGTNASLSKAAKESVSSLKALENAANNANAAVRKEVTPINELKKAITELNKNKINIVDEAALKRQNKLVQELEDELRRAQNIGKVGFDDIGNAISKTSANTGLLSGSFGQLGGSLTKGLSGLRTLAYIIPGLGIAGIFNLGFEAITAAAGALNLFNNNAEKTAKDLKKIADEESLKFGKDSFIDGATGLANLTEKVRLAKSGFLDKKGVLKEYNETLGETIGKVKTLGEAEQKIIDDGPKYLQFLLLKAKAEYAFKKAAEDSYNASVQQDKLNNAKGVINPNAARRLGSSEFADNIKKNQIPAISDFRKQFDNSAKGISDNLKQVDVAQKNSGLAAEISGKKQLDSLKKTENQSKKTAQSAFEAFEAFAKDNGFKEFVVEQENFIKVAEKQLSFRQRLDNLLQKGVNSNAKSGLTGIDSDIQKVNTSFDESIRKLQQFKADVSQAIKAGAINKGEGFSLISDANGGIGNSEVQRQKEINDARLAEVQRVSNEIQRINDQFGVKSAESQQKELAQIEATYNAEVIKAQGNEAILIELREGRLNAIAAINSKYLAQEQDLYQKIGLLEQESNAASGNKIEKETDKITIEFAKRKKAANDLFEALKKINPANAGAITRDQNNFNINSDKDEKSAQTRLANRPIENALRQVTTGFIRDLSDGLFNASSKAGADFASVFSGITSNLASTIQNVVIGNLSESLAKGIDLGLKGMSAKLQGIIGGLAVAGGLVSGLTPKTSSIGQGIGGALSGAATGAAIGSIVPGIGTAIGAGVGAIAGLVGGLFGSAKARKEQEERQKQQLEEEKKQTALLRQQTLAYTSAIIGRQTANGVVTGIEVGATGQLIATVSGRDLQFILDRNAKTR